MTTTATTELMEHPVPEVVPIEPLSPEALIALAIRSGTSVDAIERLMTLRERLHAEKAREAFFTALSRFQAECPVLPKTKTARIQSDRGSYEYKFSPLDEIAKRIAPVLERHGLSYTFDTAFKDGAQVVTCFVHHVLGHTEDSTFTAPIDPSARMNAMQKSGSSQTYGKRYTLQNALGIVSGDDDDDARATGLKDPPTAEEKHERQRPGGPRQDSQSAGTEARPETEGKTGEAGETGGGEESGTAGRAGRPDVDTLREEIGKLEEAFGTVMLPDVMQAVAERFCVASLDDLDEEQCAVVLGWVAGRMRRGQK